jgi:Tol biopolymer transport system component/DNA-binding winged helix-turn-helix (wHTH) protein
VFHDKVVTVSQVSAMASQKESNPVLYHFDDVVVDCENFRVVKAGDTRTLTPRAFDLLAYLARNHGRVVEKQDLFEQVWKGSFVTDNALTRAIKEIRRAIGDDAESPRYIETVPKRGYRFIAELKDAEKAGTARPKSITTDFAAPVAARQESGAPAEPTVSLVLDRLVKVKSRPKLRGLSFLGVAIVLGAIALVVWRIQNKPGPIGLPVVLRTTQLTTWSGLDIFPALSPDANSIAYCSDHSGSFEIYVSPLTPGAREIQITSDGQQNFEPSWSPDGKQIAYYSKNRGGIWVVPSSGGVARQLTEFGSRPAWSPDGSRLAFQSDPLKDLSATSVGAMPPSTLWMISSQGGDPIPITQVGNPPGGHGAPSWSPDRKRLVFIAFDGVTAEMWTASADGHDLQKVIADRAWFYDPIYSPDGQYLYYGGVSTPGNFVLFKVPISTASGKAIGGPLEIANMGLVRIKHLTISADGKKIAYSAPIMIGNIMSVPLSPSSNEAIADPVSVTQSTSYRKGLPVISPDGRKIAFVDFRGGTNQDIWVMDADGKNVTQLTTDPAIDWAPSWFPDADQIAFQSNRQGKWMIWSLSINSGKEKALVDAGPDIGWPKLSPDGRQIAFNSSRSGTMNIWAVPTNGGQPRQLTFDTESMGWPCWSPDGKLLALEMKRGDDTQIAIMPSGGGEPAQLTHDHGQSWAYSWSPDGDKIAFAGLRKDYWNLWWVSRGTRAEKQLTDYSKLNAFVRYPSWSPLGNRIVYEYSETTGNIWTLELK